MTARPVITVCSVVSHGEKFLLVEERVHGRLVLNQPAGHVEQGESLIRAVVRETLEETGWEFIPDGITGIYRWSSPVENKTFVRVCFFGRAGHHDPERPLDEGIVRALWLDRAALDARSSDLRSPMVMRCIEDFTAGKRYPLDMLVDLSEAGC